ncbi:MAG TPA: hypothetical protein DEQ68_04575, partial [Ruminococcaceae bacterium]|nr:hypothetical protein [Oscillospiraceae bacterium]
LRPLEVVGVCGVDLALPIERKTERFKLTAEAIYISFGNDSRVNFIFDSVVFGRQTERVPAHG